MIAKVLYGDSRAVAASGSAPPRNDQTASSPRVRVRVMVRVRVARGQRGR